MRSLRHRHPVVDDAGMVRSHESNRCSFGTVAFSEWLKLLMGLACGRLLRLQVVGRGSSHNLSAARPLRAEANAAKRPHRLVFMTHKTGEISCRDAFSPPAWGWPGGSVGASRGHQVPCGSVFDHLPVPRAWPKALVRVRRPGLIGAVSLRSPLR